VPIAGLEWVRVDLDERVVAVARQFTHGAWSELKTANSRGRIPIAKELLLQLWLHRLRTPGELVFPGPGGAPIECHNWRDRVWAQLLKKAGVSGKFHMPLPERLPPKGLRRIS
jgi:integrase